MIQIDIKLIDKLIESQEKIWKEVIFDMKFSEEDISKAKKKTNDRIKEIMEEKHDPT
jgi:hypothetical protein